MGRLILLRHAHAEPGADDLSRPLSERGRREATEVGRWLRSVGWVPEVAVSSPAVRAVDTARLALEAAASPAQLERRGALYSGPPAAYVLEEQGCVLVVGHNPTIEQAASLLARQALHMTPACAACFQDGVLVHFAAAAPRA